MDDCGIPFSFRTRSAGGESALFVARRSIYFDLFAALLNFGITPPPKWHPPYVNAHETPTRFLYPGDKKRLVRQAGGGCLRNLPAQTWTCVVACAIGEWNRKGILHGRLLRKKVVRAGRSAANIFTSSSATPTAAPAADRPYYVLRLPPFRVIPPRLLRNRPVPFSILPWT